MKALIEWVQPAWISDHLCWTGVAHKNAHDLLPVPYTEEALNHIIRRIKEVQDYLERPIALENPSTYLEFNQSSMPEAEFIARMAEESGCNLLLDVNNVYVTCYNHRIDAIAYLDCLPLDSVIQIHLSGHSNKGTYIIDTHDDYVIDEVWNLYRYVVNRAKRVPNTMVEWDDKIPEFLELQAELTRAKEVAMSARSYLAPELYHEQVPQPLHTPTPLLHAQTLMLDAIMLGNRLDTSPDTWIRAKPDFAPQDQLNVYINAYRYRLYDVVSEDYPVLKQFLGNDSFYDLIWAFVNKVRPMHFNIGRFALKLPAFVKEYIINDEFAYELCQFETTIAQLTDPAETAPLEQKHLDGITPDEFMRSRLYPRKALQIMAFTYPVNIYYRKVMDEESPKKPRRKTTYLVVFRHQDLVWRMDLEKSEYCLLIGLFNGKTVGDALDDMIECTPKKVSEYFSRWMRNGLLAAPEYNNEKLLDTHHETA